MASEIVEAAGALAPVAAEHAVQTERERQLAAPVLEGLLAADLFRICVPRTAGGGECTARDMVEAIEALAYGDASAGWCLMIAATSGLVGGWLDGETASEVFGDPAAPCGGVFAPRGQAVADGNGGYRASGRWPFSSGVTHAGWMQGGCMVREGEQPRLLPGGGPDVHLLIWPRADLEVVDTWDVAGLRGTGSHDMVVKDLAVPAERAISLFSTTRTQPGPLYAFPVFGLLAAGISAVALGAARAALDDLIELAGGKTPNMSRRVLAQHGHAQATSARAEARRRAARGFLLEAIDTAWEEAETGGELSVPARASLRLAATHAMTEAAAVVDAAYTLAGGTSIYATSPLQRRFRDVHVATQHMMVGPATWELAGKVVLGLEVDPAMI